MKALNQTGVRPLTAMSNVKTMRSFVTAQQVAAAAGVSRSAVSRTFTDGASVSERTRRKVLEAAEQLGYHVNHLARGLIQDASGQLLGAVGVSGDTSDNDEICAIAGIEAAGLKANPG